MNDSTRTDPHQTLFCRALIALAPAPRLALRAFARRLLARHTSAMV